MIDAYITEVEGLSLREVAGAGARGCQVELQIRRPKGKDLAVRLIGRRGKPIRVMDLRAKDRDGKKKSPLIEVPFNEVLVCKD